MEKKVKCEGGFSLIELTLVLSIAIALTVSIIPFGLKKIQEKTEKDAIDLLISSIYSLQSYAMAHNEFVVLSAWEVDGKTHYIGERLGGEVLIEHTLPEGMQVSSSSPLKRIEFHGNGDIIKLGVFVITSETKRINITFQFQRGRMIIRESERVLLDRSDFNRRNFVSRF